MVEVVSAAGLEASFALLLDAMAIDFEDSVSWKRTPAASWPLFLLLGIVGEITLLRRKKEVKFEEILLGKMRKFFCYRDNWRKNFMVLRLKNKRMVENSFNLDQHGLQIPKMDYSTP